MNDNGGKMRQKVHDQVIKDILSITPLVRRDIQRKVLKSAFTHVEHDITLPHLEIMKVLQEEGSLHIAEIGERLQIPKPQMTHLVDRLEALGIASRRTDEYDRRITNVSLTPKGQQILGELDEILYSSIDERLSVLSEEELPEISMSLRKLAGILAKL